MLMRMSCLCEVVERVNDSVKASVKSHAVVLHVTERCASVRAHVRLSPVTGRSHAYD